VQAERPPSTRNARRGGLFRRVVRWLAQGRGVVFFLLAIGVLDLALWTWLDLNNRYAQELELTIFDADEDGQTDGTVLDAGYALAMRTLARGLLCLGPGFAIWLWRRRRAGHGMVWPALLGSGYAGTAALAAMLFHGLPEATAGQSGDEPYVGPFLVGVALLAGLFALVPALVWLYQRAPLLDKYVTRAFLTPFLLCFCGFLSIWLISDMANKGGDYAAVKLPVADIVTLYLAQLPAVVVLILPIALLLAVLYALGRMSRRNELVSMMMAGKAVPRILLPLFVIGAAATYVSLACNYQYAPGATGTVKSLLANLSKSSSSKNRYAAFDQAFLNRAQNRLWFIGLYPAAYNRDSKMESVVVVQFNEQDRLKQTIHANRAFWQRHDGLWVFFGAQVTDFNDKGEPVAVTTHPGKYLVTDWPETPWKLVSSGLNPEYLGLPQLDAYLQAYRDLPPDKLAPFLTHWHHRLSLPLGCLAAVLFGAPLGIVYSRRGLVGSVSTAVAIFFASMFFTNFFVALGQGARLPAVPAAWLPPLAFCALGLWLVRLRSHNREMASPRAWLAARFRRPRHA
jgi:lipopolysaccharide export system permease protein